MFKHINNSNKNNTNRNKINRKQLNESRKFSENICINMLNNSENDGYNLTDKKIF